MVTIRTATTNDATIIALLGRITYSESHGKYIDNKKHLLNYNNDAFSLKKIKESLSIPDNVFYLIYVNKLPVGYAKLVLNTTFNNKTPQNSCRLERIYILNDFLPLKIGQQLYNTVINKAISLNFECIWLSVYIKNNRAIQFYRKNNFTKIGVLQFKVNKKEYENTVFVTKLERIKKN
ncbi:GNAT family N-acetyltransferase [Tenacibaculum sp. nBUS_03]|uniref:GNAT family N-acetyltransferase n=1 Tax=Tenacibaculum sp. nBUS_03 TaxID=3395320 RepID=UPI003EBC05D7